MHGLNVLHVWSCTFRVYSSDGPTLDCAVPPPQGTECDQNPSRTGSSAWTRCHTRQRFAPSALRLRLRLTRKHLRAKSTMLSSRHLVSSLLVRQSSLREGCVVSQLPYIHTSLRRFTLYRNIRMARTDRAMRPGDCMCCTSTTGRCACSAATNGFDAWAAAHDQL
jgi:hypothetical protein